MVSNGTGRSFKGIFPYNGSQFGPWGDIMDHNLDHGEFIYIHV